MFALSMVFVPVTRSWTTSLLAGLVAHPARTATANRMARNFFLSPPMLSRRAYHVRPGTSRVAGRRRTLGRVAALGQRGSRAIVPPVRFVLCNFRFMMQLRLQGRAAWLPREEKSKSFIRREIAQKPLLAFSLLIFSIVFAMREQAYEEGHLLDCGLRADPRL